MPGRAEVPEHRREAHAQELLRKPVQGLGALEVLRCVVRVDAQDRQELRLEDRCPVGAFLRFQVRHGIGDEVPHAVATKTKKSMSASAQPKESCKNEEGGGTKIG